MLPYSAPLRTVRPPIPMAFTGYESFITHAHTSRKWTCCSTLKSPDSPVTDSVGATLSIPFGGEVHRAATLSPLQLDLARAEDDLALALRMATLVLHEAEHELHAREQALQLAAGQKAVAEREVELARRAYRLGESSLAERLLVEARAANARRAAALADIAYERAVARYNNSLGILP